MAEEAITTKPTRRDFLNLLWIGLGGAVTLEMAALTLAYTQPRLTEGEFGSIINVGFVDEFPPGSVTHIPDGRFYLVRLQDGGFLAIYQRCTHLGCSVPWDQAQGQFVCPCHNSQFTSVGDVLNSPAPRPLDLFPITIQDNMIMVDTGRLIERDRFDPSQVTYA